MNYKFHVSVSVCPLIDNKNQPMSARGFCSYCKNMIGRTEWGKLSSAARAARFFIQFFWRSLPHNDVKFHIREIKQPRRRRQQKPYKFAYLTMKNSIFARFARAYFIIWPFEDVLVLSTTWNDLFCSCVDDVSIWWQMLIFVFLCPKRWFQFNSRIVRAHFSSIITLSNWEMIAKPRSYIFRWRSRFRRRRVCFSSLFWGSDDNASPQHLIFHYLLLHKNHSCQASESAQQPLSFSVVWPVSLSKLLKNSLLINWWVGEHISPKTFIFPWHCSFNLYYQMV